MGSLTLPHAPGKGKFGGWTPRRNMRLLRTYDKRWSVIHRVAASVGDSVSYHITLVLVACLSVMRYHVKCFCAGGDRLGLVIAYQSPAAVMRLLQPMHDCVDCHLAPMLLCMKQGWKKRFLKSPTRCVLSGLFLGGLTRVLLKCLTWLVLGFLWVFSYQDGRC